MAMDTDWALVELKRFVAAAKPHHTQQHGPYRVATYAMTTDEDLAGQLAIVEQVLGRVLPSWRTSVAESSYDRWQQHREAAQRAIVHLEREVELREKLGENAPVLDAGRLHPWVWEGARSLWASGHFAEAVSAAARQVNAETQNKVGRRDVSETDLLTQSFSDNAPTPTQPRLRPPGDDDGKSAKSLRRGIRSYAEGCYAALRNPAAHDVHTELPEAEALEQLAAFSVLARWVDRAEVVRP